MAKFFSKITRWLTTYKSYRSYKIATKVNNAFLIIFGVCLICCLFPIDKTEQVLFSSLGLFSLTIFLLRYYWVEAKKKQMVAFSKDAKRSLGLVSKSLNLFDGALEIEGVPTIEISIVPEATLVGAIFQMMRRQKSADDFEDEIQDIELYVRRMEKFKDKYRIYATLPQDVADRLTSDGLKLSPLPKLYLNRPSRLAYASKMHSLNCALGSYPTFKAFSLSGTARK